MNCMKAVGRAALLCLGLTGAGAASAASAGAGLTLTGTACDGHGTGLTSQAGFIACSGVLTFAPQTGKFVVSLKAGDAFSLYEFDGSSVAGGIRSIDFDTLGVGFQSRRKLHDDQGLSHADLYGDGAASVPEPASALLALAGIGALALIARRRARTR